MSKNAQRFQSFYDLGYKRGQEGGKMQRKSVPKRFNRVYAKGWHDGRRGVKEQDKGAIQAMKDYISKMGSGGVRT